MKKLLTVLALSFCLFSAEAKTIHWITFIDTTDENVGEIDINSRKFLYSRWINVVNAAMVQNGYRTAVYDFYGIHTSPENCRRAIRDLRCDPDDIVIFYYIGHGTRAADDVTKYPQMLLAQLDENKLIPLSWVHRELKAKNARLTLTIGMCCNSVQHVRARQEPTFGVNYGNTYMSPSQVMAIQKAFLENKGDIIACSSAPGEPSSACSVRGIGDTDFCTFCFISQFEEMTATDTFEWKNFFTEVQDEVRKSAAAVTGRRQVPQFDVNLSKSESPAPTQPERPTAPSKPSMDDPDDLSKLVSYIESSLDFIREDNDNLEDRIQMSQELRTVFDRDAEVKVLGQDMDVVVDKEDIDAFLMRISTSSLLYRVSMVDGEISGRTGKITMLRVREIYKK